MGRANRVIPVIIDGRAWRSRARLLPPCAALQARSRTVPSREEREERSPPTRGERATASGSPCRKCWRACSACRSTMSGSAKRSPIARRIRIVAAAVAVFVVVTMVAGYFVWHASEQSRREAALVEEYKRRDDEQRKRDEEFRTQLAAMQATYSALAGKLVGGAAPGSSGAGASGGRGGGRDRAGRGGRRRPAQARVGTCSTRRRSRRRLSCCARLPRRRSAPPRPAARKLRRPTAISAPSPASPIPSEPSKPTRRRCSSIRMTWKSRVGRASFKLTAAN